MADLLDLEGGRSRIVSTFYEATDFLGRGRFADVYKAFDQNTQTDVVLKIYRGADVQAHEFAAAEAETLRAIESLNTGFFPKLRSRLKSRLHNQNHPLLVMELGQYIGADSVKQILRLQDIVPTTSNSEVVELASFWELDHLQDWILDLAIAIRSLHSKGIIHRDLKPSNVLVKRAAGADRALPFIIDFNTSVRASSDSRSFGTERYLPPEVKAGTRIEPTEADDLWALAMLIWEMIYGIGHAVRGEAKPHALVPGFDLANLRDALACALQPNPSARHQTAGEFYEAIRDALIAEQTLDSDGSLTVDELTWARESAERIRTLVVDDFSSADELPVPKDVRERVASLYIWLAEHQTRSFDLKGDLLQLGPRAVPALIEESYKIPIGSEEVSTIADAVATLAATATGLADAALEFYANSSNLAVRQMCRATCKKRRRVPKQLVDLLLDDSGLLLPSERVELADLCIQFSDDQYALLVLTKYMCREYVLDQNQYFDLRDRIAARLGEVQFKQSALLVLEDSFQRIWRELDEFQALPTTARDECERGILQLMGDAFASMGDEAFRLVRNRLQTSLNDDWKRRVWRVFCRKLGQRHGKVGEWAKRVLGASDDRQLQWVLRPLVEERGSQQESTESIAEVFARYLRDGEQRDYNALRFCKDRRVFDYISATARGTESLVTLGRVLGLLEGFENRHRVNVLRAMIDGWPKLSSLCFDRAVEVMTKYRIDPGPIHDQVIETLGRELSGPNASAARRGLENFLG